LETAAEPSALKLAAESELAIFNLREVGEIDAHRIRQRA